MGTSGPLPFLRLVDNYEQRVRKIFIRERGRDSERERERERERESERGGEREGERGTIMSAEDNALNTTFRELGLSKQRRKTEKIEISM